MEQNIRQVRITVDLPEQIVIDAKIKAAKRRMTLRQVVMSSLLITLYKEEYNKENP